MADMELADEYKVIIELLKKYYGVQHSISKSAKNDGNKTTVRR